MSDYHFIEAKINHPQFGVQALIEDYERIDNADANYQEYNTELENLKLIKEALRLSAHVLNEDKKQLAGQLTGRLLSFEKQTAIQNLLNQISQTKITWLRPLTASLTPPGNGLIRTLSGHSRSVSAIAVSHDGKYVVSGSGDNTIKVWEFATGTQIRTLSGHSDSVSAIAVSHDGKYVVSGSDDKTIKVWEFATGTQIRTLSGHSDSVRAIAMSHDSKYVVSGSDDKTIKVWEFATETEICTLRGHSHWVRAIALSSDGKYVVSSSNDNTIKVWELATGKQIVTFTAEGNIHSCAITPDGAKIVVGDSLGNVHFLRLEGVEVQS